MAFLSSLSREIRYEIKKLFRRLRGPVVQLTLVVTLVIGALALFISPSGRALETDLLRVFFWIRGARAVSDQVVVVAIDDVSFGKLGSSPREPMPRRYVAQALQVVRDAAPRLVVIDANIPAERFIDPDADAALERALRGGPFAIWSGALPDKVAEPYGNVTIASDEPFRRAAKMELPMTLFAEGEEVVYISDPGVLESDPLESRVWMSKPFKEIAGVSIEAPGQFDLINFYGPPGTVPRIPLYALLQVESRASIQEKLRGKIILFGYQSIHYGRSILNKDELRVPVSSRGMFGVELHATVAGNLLEGSWLRRLSLSHELLFVTLVVLLVGSIVVRAPRPRVLAGVMMVYGALVLGGYLMFARYYVWIAGLPTIGVAIGVMIIMSSGYFFMRSESYRRYIDKTFSFRREEDF